MFGTLIQSECNHESCSNCLVLESENHYLKQKVRILESILDTSETIAEINQTLLSNHDTSINQTLTHQLNSDVGVQTDPPDNSDVIQDGLFEVPESFMLIDSNGNVEGPDSLFSCDSEYEGNLSFTTAISTAQ